MSRQGRAVHRLVLALALGAFGFGWVVPAKAWSIAAPDRSGSPLLVRTLGGDNAPGHSHSSSSILAIRKGPGGMSARPNPPPASVKTAPPSTPSPNVLQPSTGSAAAIAAPTVAPVTPAPLRVFRSEPPVSLPPSIAWSAMDEVLVATRGEPGGNIQSLAEAYDLGQHTEVSLPTTGLTLTVIRVPNASVRDALIERLNSDARVVAAQPNYRYRTLASRTAPASAPAPRQYALEAINALEAHRIATGKGVMVGLIDTRVDRASPALADSVVEEIDLTGKGAADPGQHGTGLAGVMAAQATADAIEGIAPDARIVAIQAFEPDPGDPTLGIGSSQRLAQAIDIALKRQVNVLNLSFSGPRDPIVSHLLQRAMAAGVVVVAAAGNDGPEGPPRYPAAQEGVIAVTATDALGRLYAMATHGPFVSVAAPGVDILTVGPRGSLQYLSGTSLAAAHVSAVVALMLEAAPTLPPAEVKRILEGSARPGGPQRTHSDGFGAGRIDALAAITAVGPRLAKSPAKALTN